MIKVKTIVFCENVMSTEMFTKCLRPIIQQCLSCQHGAPLPGYYQYFLGSKCVFA